MSPGYTSKNTGDYGIKQVPALRFTRSPAGNVARQTGSVVHGMLLQLTEHDFKTFTAFRLIPFVGKVQSEMWLFVLMSTSSARSTVWSIVVEPPH